MKNAQNYDNKKNSSQKGFSLVELLIGLVIGLIVTLVISNAFNRFEQQKRGTTGTSDAQTNGAIALYNIQRDMESAGWGLPTFGVELSPFLCPINTTIDHDGNGGTAAINLSPVVINNGTGTNGSDIISIRYGNTMKSGAGIFVANNGTNVVSVDANLGCVVGDVALIMRYTAPPNQFCQLSRVTAISAAGVTPATITLNAATAPAATITGDEIACLGAWNEHQYAIGGAGATLNQLTRTGALNAAGVPDAAPVAIVPDVVSLQAQYGITNTVADNQVTGWVDATGIWGAGITNTNRNRIRSVRVAVVARSGQRERVAVSQACSGGDPNLARVCIWENTGATDVDLTALADWANYRYRVYETVIPLRNVMWSRKVINGEFL